MEVTKSEVGYGHVADGPVAPPGALELAEGRIRRGCETAWEHVMPKVNLCVAGFLVAMCLFGGKLLPPLLRVFTPRQLRDLAVGSWVYLNSWTYGGILYYFLAGGLAVRGPGPVGRRMLLTAMRFSIALALACVLAMQAYLAVNFFVLRQPSCWAKRSLMLLPKELLEA